MTKPTPPVERWLNHLYLDGSCWRTTYRLESNGYALMHWYGKHRTSVHRFAYVTFVGPIPDGYTIDHVKARGCRFRDCSNPAHLEAVTLRENLLRGDTFQAANAAKTQCPAGHPYDAVNTRLDTQGRRICRACDRARPRREHASSGGRRLQLEQTITDLSA
jgi:HNH endonuclease